MKRKNSPSPNFLKVHTLLFTIFVVFMSYSMSATFEYSGNPSLSFETFKFFVIERVTLMQLWGTVLLFHFGLHYIRSGWQKRDAMDTMYPQHLEADAEEPQATEDYPDTRKASLH